MGEIKNCRSCGKIFTYMGGQPICRECRNIEEEQFKKVKEYLYENPGATITEIAMELDISVKKIKQYLREGRLEIINDDGNMMLECERCGKAIKTGRYCELCQREIVTQLKGAADKIASSTRAAIRADEFGIRFINKGNRNK
jgi:flagellar operon protein (TIGR03826 family)